MKLKLSLSLGFLLKIPPIHWLLQFSNMTSVSGQSIILFNTFYLITVEKSHSKTGILDWMLCWFKFPSLHDSVKYWSCRSQSSHLVEKLSWLFVFKQKHFILKKIDPKCGSVVSCEANLAYTYTSTEYPQRFTSTILYTGVVMTSC